MVKERKNEIFQHKVIMVGSGGVGKSAITLQYMYSEFTETYDPTKAESYCNKIILDNQECNINILDTAGQEEYAAIRDNYYRSGEGFVCVFSICEKDSFKRIQEFRDQICRVLDNEKIPFILVGNKCDLANERQVDRQEAEAKAKEWGCPYIETSAKTKENVKETFVKILRIIIEKKKESSKIQPKTAKKGKCMIL